MFFLWFHDETGSKTNGRNSSSQSTDCVSRCTKSLKSKLLTEMLKKGTLRRHQDKRGVIRLSLFFTCGPQKPWFKGPTPPQLTHTSHHPHLKLLANCGLFSFCFVLFFNVCSRTATFFGTVLNQSERVLHALNGLISHEKERVREVFFPRTSTHYFTCIYRCIYRTWGHTLWEALRLKNEGNNGCCWEAWSIYLRPWIHNTNIHWTFHPIFFHHVHTHTHKCHPSPLRPASLDPTDSLQSALEPRGSSLPLEPVSDTVTLRWRWQSQRPLPPGRTKQRKKGQDFRTARTAVVVLKGSLYRNALFMIVIIIIVMII